MDHTSSILIYGKDAALLNTRAQVLKQVGPVTQVATVEDLQSSLQEQPFGLMVLCHTGNVVEHDLALQLATSIQPDMKRLLVATGQTKTPAENVETLSNLAGPQALVDRAKLMLSQSALFRT